MRHRFTLYTVKSFKDSNVVKHTLTTEEELREAAEEYLMSLHTIQWMDWDIAKPERRALAIDAIIRLAKGIGVI